METKMRATDVNAVSEQYGKKKYYKALCNGLHDSINYKALTWVTDENVGLDSISICAESSHCD
jgi:hypothetical protein